MNEVSGILTAANSEITNISLSDVASSKTLQAS
jgi:hypothetical protein